MGRLLRCSAALAAAITLSPLGAAYAGEESPKPDIGYLFSARGPGEGGVLGLGGRVFVVVPTFDVLYARSLAEKAALDLRLSTLGVGSFAEAAVRYKLADEGRFALALRGGAEVDVFALALGGEAAAAASARLNPGVVASFGGGPTQVTLGLDVPVSFVEGAVGGDSINGVDAFVNAGLSAGLRPSAAVEFAVGRERSRSMFIQAQLLALLAGENSGVVLPNLAAGVAW